MIREKIFRLHRHKSSPSSSSLSTDASAHKFDFTFSNIQAIQVPKGWEKVSLSLISPESGKTVRKTGKVAVRKGVCQWTETFSESVWISGVDGSKNPEECLFKFVLAAGSSKSSTLGDICVNLAAFLSSSSPMLVSLPLKHCVFGTILQVEVKCLTPKTDIRGEKWREMQEKIDSIDHDYIASQSEVSDSMSASNNVDSSSRGAELSSRETSFSASVSRYSFESLDDSQSVFLRQESIESNDSSTNGSRGSQKNQSSLFQRNGGVSSKAFKEVDDVVFQELNAEALMWEQNTRRLSVEVEKLRNELCRSRSECREYGEEIERLKKQNDEWRKEFEDEMRFQKEENENTFLQFNKTQESNIELISILQEMEETIEKQKCDVFVLESALEDQLIAAEIEQDVTNRILREFTLAAKEAKTNNSKETRGDSTLMEQYLCELQDENVYFSQRISGLEATLRYLSDRTESSSSELRFSEVKIANLEREIGRLEQEMESQKIEMKQKMLVKEKQLEEAQEECASLSKLNVMLQATTENLIDEYNSLQSFNVEVREQKMKLQEHLLVLESAARENLGSSDKVKESELERIRLADENCLLHMQLRKVQKLESEVLGLRVLVKELGSRNLFLQRSFESVSGDYEEVRREKDCAVERVRSMERAASEREEIARRKNVLEEKVLRLEGDVIARDALCVQNVEMKHEMSMMKMANSELSMRVKQLEEIRNGVRPDDGEDEGAKSKDKSRALEAEVEELRGRYLEMSLKYAQVEGEREELVMKLKASS